jgi:uncharacterized protein
VTKPLEIETPHGPARAHVDGATGARGWLALGHGAGGGIESPDIQAAAEVAREEGLTTALVEQPYRVAGRRSPAPPKQLDPAWLAVIAGLREGDLGDVPLIAGGRSLSGRVACRTAGETGAVAVLCLAFPVHPPGKPEKSRMSELDAVEVPTLVVQGESDPFGMPEAGPDRKVVTVKGSHSLKDLDAVAGAVRDWLPRAVRA